jgi:hypothetical protein
MLKIVIENPQMIVKKKKDGGEYRVQEAWAYTHGPNGPHPHPQRIEVFPMKQGDSIVPYSAGEYSIDDSSYAVKFSRLDIFIKLIPWAESLQQAKQVIVASKAA